VMVAELIEFNKTYVRLKGHHEPEGF
jgi:hypothetical protein